MIGLPTFADAEPQMTRVHDLFLALDRAEGPAWESLLDEYEAALAEWIAGDAPAEPRAA